MVVQLEQAGTIGLEKESHLRELVPFAPDLRPAIAQVALAYAASIDQPVTAILIRQVGGVISEAANTGHVDAGDGSSNPIIAALTAEQAEFIARQRSHMKPRQYVIPNETVRTISCKADTHFIELPLTPDQYRTLVSKIEQSDIRVSVWLENH
jgi:hypothetical protein